MVCVCLFNFLKFETITADKVARTTFVTVPNFVKIGQTGFRDIFASQNAGRSPSWIFMRVWLVCIVEKNLIGMIAVTSIIRKLFMFCAFGKKTTIHALLGLLKV